MNSPAHDVALYLAAQGAGVFAGTGDWAINVAAEPPSPDACTTLYDLAGGVPDTDQLDVFVNNIQVRTRSASYTDAYKQQRLIRQLLILPTKMDMTTSVVTAIDLLSDVGSIGKDTNSRFILTATYRIRRIEKGN